MASLVMGLYLTVSQEPKDKKSIVFYDANNLGKLKLLQCNFLGRRGQKWT